MEIGEKIKVYADEHGIMQKFLAEKSGMTPSQMSLVMSGQRTLNVIEYFNICKALNVSMEYFMED